MTFHARTVASKEPLHSTTPAVVVPGTPAYRARRYGWPGGRNSLTSAFPVVTTYCDAWRTTASYDKCNKFTCPTGWRRGRVATGAHGVRMRPCPAEAATNRGGLNWWSARLFHQVLLEESVMSSNQRRGGKGNGEIGEQPKQANR